MINIGFHITMLHLILSRQIPILLQDTTPYVVTEIWENTLPLFNPGQY